MFEDDLEEEEVTAEDVDADLDVDEVPLEEADDDFSDDGTDLGAAPDADDDEEVERPVRSAKTKAAVNEDELPTVVAKQKERDALAEAMAAFLKKGGKIQALESEDD